MQPPSPRRRSSHSGHDEGDAEHREHRLTGPLEAFDCDFAEADAGGESVRSQMSCT
jgi:hypothetical protein